MISMTFKGWPVEAVEFLNELRHEGALVLADDGWRWDLARARNTVGGVLNDTCDRPGTTRGMPYTADYVFLRK